MPYRRRSRFCRFFALGTTVYLWHIFLVKPLAALSVLLCLVTILSCVALERKRPYHRADRFLIGFLGLLAVYQGLRILQGAGIVALGPPARVDGAIDLVMPAIYLLATLVLRLATAQHLDAESAMRLVNAAPPRFGQPPRNPETERDLARLSWALPRLSDGAFRLYAYLCLHPEQAARSAAVFSAEIRAQLGKSQAELDRAIAELERAGAVSMPRDEAAGIIVLTPPAGPPIPPASVMPENAA
jgi:hypothetical protein